MNPPIRFVERVVSTNDAVADLARAGAATGTAVVAAAQDKGRGRLGRSWLSSPGSALLMSVLLRPRVELAHLPLVMLAVAVEVATGCGPEFRIKWPNDVLGPDGRKVAGILAESEFAGGRLAHVVVGIGINLRAAPPIDTAACLHDYGVHRDIPDLAERLVDRIVAAVVALETSAGREQVRSAWCAKSHTLGRHVRIGEVVGRALGIADDGALIVATDAGEQRIIRSGDVEMIAAREA